jgi:hypothetical protein
MPYPAWRIQQQRQRMDWSCTYEKWSVCCVVKNVCKQNRTDQMCYILYVNIMTVQNVILVTHVMCSLLF